MFYKLKIGKISVEEYFPTSQTISNNVPRIYDVLNAKVFKILKDVNGAGITFDLWKHKHSNAHYITLTFHYITNDTKNEMWKINNLVLATREFKMIKTGTNIKVIL